MIQLRRIDTCAAVRKSRGSISREVIEASSLIVERVREEGDTALRSFAHDLDELMPGAPLALERPDLEVALDTISAPDRELLERTAERIRSFATAQRSALQDFEVTSDGLTMGHRVTAAPVAGCYAPGGRYPLPSSVLMTAITARVAGVETVVVASPSPRPIMLAAAAIAGADLMITAGGAQAIAAMACGTETVPACDVIVGPGNAWVTAAKQLVAGKVRIDSLAGPSELLVVADGSTNAALVAADLLAQAEHDPAAIPILVSMDERLVARVEEELDRQLTDLPTAATARQALDNGGAILVSGAAEAVAACNHIAPEHLQWMARDLESLNDLRHFGGLFVGEGAAEVLGDYGAGPNHVLPTGGQARARGGLSVFDFLKANTWMRAQRGHDASPLADDAAALARIEGLEAHARAAQARSSVAKGAS